MSSQTQTGSNEDRPWYKSKPFFAGVGLLAALRVVRRTRRAAAKHRNRVALKELRKNQRQRAYAERQREQRAEQRRRAQREEEKRRRKGRRRGPQRRHD